MDILLIFFLNCSFLDILEKNQKPVCLISGVSPVSVYNLKWLHICDSDWLNFIHFSGYKYKIRLVSILRKREDQALIYHSKVFSSVLINPGIPGHVFAQNV